MPALTTTLKLKDQLGLKSTSDELSAYLERVIAGASALVQSYTGQKFGYDKTTKAFNPPAQAAPVLVIPAPIVAIETLKCDGQIWNAVDYDDTALGYTMENGKTATKLFANRTSWPMRPRSIVATYWEGYALDLFSIIPSTLTLNAPTHSVKDLGVFINGIAALKVAETPAEGQYTESQGVYNFAAADEGKDVELNYAGTPADIELAVLDIAATAYAGRDRYGVASKALAGQETVTFTQDSLPPSAKATLQLYRAVI